MPGVPTYLRWIAALTAGLTAQFAFFIITGAIAVGTDNTELTGGVGLAISFGSIPVTILPALAVNDWLNRRYPKAQSPSDSR